MNGKWEIIAGLLIDLEEINLFVILKNRNIGSMEYRRSRKNVTVPTIIETSKNGTHFFLNGY